MKQDNTNSTPLWRELRDKITSGEAGANTHSQYTALAVNNLHKLAEALTRIREASLQGLEMYANGEKFSFETLAGYVAEISGEALSAIS